MAKKTAPPTDGHRQMLREIRAGLLFTVPTWGSRLRCWKSMEGRWVTAPDGKPALTVEGANALDRLDKASARSCR